MRDDVAENIKNDLREQYQPSREEQIEIMQDVLRGGDERPRVDGFDDILERVRDKSKGDFTTAEFREYATEAFEAALGETLDDGDLDAESHATLDAFEEGDA